MCGPSRKTENRLGHGNHLAEVIIPPYGDDEPDIGEWVQAHQAELSQGDRQLFDEFSGQVKNERICRWVPSKFERSGAFDPEAYQAFKEVAWDYDSDELCQMAISLNVSPSERECKLYGTRGAVVEALAERMGMEDLTIGSPLPVKHWAFEKDSGIKLEDAFSCPHTVIQPIQSLWEKAKFKVLSTIECAVVEGELDIDHTESIRVSRGADYPETVGRIDVEYPDDVPYEVDDEGRTWNNPLGTLVRKVLKAIILPQEEFEAPSTYLVRSRDRYLSIPETVFVDEEKKEELTKLCQKLGIPVDKIPRKVEKLDEQRKANYRGYYRPGMRLSFSSTYEKMKWLVDMKFFVRWADGNYSPRGNQDLWPIHHEELDKLLDLAKSQELDEDLLLDSLHKMDEERMGMMILDWEKEAHESFLWLSKQIKKIQKKYPCHDKEKVNKFSQRRIKIQRDGKSNLVSTLGFLKLALWKKLGDERAPGSVRAACWSRVNLLGQNYIPDVTRLSDWVRVSEAPGYLGLNKRLINGLHLPVQTMGKQAMVNKLILNEVLDKLIENENKSEDILDSFTE